MAVALAKKAIERGYGAYFVRAYDLMEDLRKARAEHNLDRRLRVYLAPRVLVVDEFGIWPYNRDAATAFFTLVSARCERGSIILTSNKGFGEWGELLGDTVIASAILDRLLHHSHVLNIPARATVFVRSAMPDYSAPITCLARHRRTGTTTTPPGKVPEQLTHDGTIEQWLGGSTLPRRYRNQAGGGSTLNRRQGDNN